MAEKLFVGDQVRALRQDHGLKLQDCAGRLGISVSYLSQIEANQRPVTSRVLFSIADVFGVAPEVFEAREDERLIADLKEAVAESAQHGDHVGLSEIRRVALQAPTFARRFLELHRANQRLSERLNLTEAAVALDEATAASSLLPYEEVRDFFHDHDNYLDAIDRAAETLAESVGIDGLSPPDHRLVETLRERYGIHVVAAASGEVMRRYDPTTRTLAINPRRPAESQTFQLAYHLVATELSPIIEAELSRARFRTAEAVDVCRVGLCNYAAGALLMPYRLFHAEARTRRHDVEALALHFRTSLEQVCHRFSTLQRPGLRGVPMFFVRMDFAGNITKRHSATRLRFARFGGACALWNVHRAVASPDDFLVQVAEMPDGARYLSVARSVAKPSGSYLEPDRHFVLGFGCEIGHAPELVYSEGVDLAGPAARIGVSCRICERNDCPQRAFPPVDRPLRVPRNERRTVPFRLD